MSSTYHDLNRIVKEAVTINRDTRDYSNRIVFSNQNNIFKGGFIGTLSTITGNIIGDNVISGVDGLCSYVKVLHQDIVTERQERIEADYDVTKIRQEIEQTRIGLSTDYSKFKDSISASFASKESLTSAVETLDSKINDKTTYYEVKNSLSNDGYATKDEIKNKNNWDEAYNLRHIHDNLDVINDISQNDIEKWNNAASSSHSHSNKDCLDLIDNSKLALSVLSDLGLDSYSKTGHTHLKSEITDLSGLTFKSLASCDVSDIVGYGITIKENKLCVNTSYLPNTDSYLTSTTTLKDINNNEISNYQPSGNYATKSDITNSGNWDTAFTRSAFISNLNYEITDTSVNNWNELYNEKHTHSNKESLDLIDDNKLALSSYDQVKEKLNLSQYALSTHTHSKSDIDELKNIQINRFISCDVSDINGDNIVIQDGCKLSVHNYTSSDFSSAFVNFGNSEYKNKDASVISSEIGLNNYQLSGNYVKCSEDTLNNTFKKVKMSGTYRDGEKENFEFYILTSDIES